MDIQVDGFEIEAEIGRGGFGVVYRARQLAFDRPAAIKVLLPNPSVDDLQRRFAQECRAVGALRAHPNVVTVYSTGSTADGRPYLAMQYLGGGALSERIPLPPDEVVALGSSLADGLAAAHAGGVIHRDVKPSNVRFGADDEPVLVDFGISSLVGDASVTGNDVALSLGYTPPEMFDGGRATPLVDVYSLGATLFAAVTGRTPFVTGDGTPSIVAVAGRVLHEPLEDLRPLGVPDGLCRVIETCMAKDPAHRYASMDEVRAALTALGAEATRQRALTWLPAAGVVPTAAPSVTGPPVTGPPAGSLAGLLPTGAPLTGPTFTRPPLTGPPGAAAPRPTGRRRSILAAAAAVLVLGGGVATAAALSGGDPRPAPAADRHHVDASLGGTRSAVAPSDASTPATSRTPVNGGSAELLPGGGGLLSTGHAGGGAPGSDPGNPGGVGGIGGRPTGTHGGRTVVRTVTAAPPATQPVVHPTTSPVVPTPPRTTPADRPPVLGPIPTLSANEGYEVRTKVTATDPDGGPLRFHVTGLPSGVTATSAGSISGGISYRASSATTTYTSIRSRTFTLTVTVTDSAGRSATGHRTWTVHDTRFAMPNYVGHRGCNGVGSCHESVRNLRQLGPHTTRCRVVSSSYVGKIVAQSLRAGSLGRYGQKFVFTVGRKTC